MTIFVYSGTSRVPVATFASSSDSECERWADSYWGQHRVPLAAMKRINYRYFDGDRIDSVTVNITRGEGAVVIYNSELLELETLAFCIVNQYGAPDPMGDRLLYRKYIESLQPTVTKKPTHREDGRALAIQGRAGARG